ncbi:hypothetical protein BGZ47_010717 [Haplosporangium gracile]|nr:hypothetical protein BGZ47_010717 [Haplosporangium gracile]
MSFPLARTRYIAAVTLPFIYRDPFNGHGATPIVKSLLTQTLLASRTYCSGISSDINDSTASTTMHPFLTMRLRQFLPSPLFASSASNTQFDYLRHVRRINQTKCGRREYGFWTSNSLSSEESAYIEEHQDEVELQCQLDDVTVTPDFANVWPYENKKGLFYHLHGVSLLRETTWALAYPILDQLESLTIPLSNVHRYRAVVDRLGRLEELCFLQDEIYQFGDTVDEGSRIRRDEAMRNLVEFVEAHVRRHPGRLKDVYCETLSWLMGFHIHFPDEIKQQVYRVLPPPTKLTIINGGNCLPVLANPQTVDLGLVEQIYQDRSGVSWLDKAIRAEPRFLQKCRRLRTIRMNSLGKGSFDWAVKEKRSFEDIGFVIIEGVDVSDDNNNVINSGCRSVAQHQQERGQPVPLESMYLYQTTYDREIDDIAFTFSRTLESLTGGIFLSMIRGPLMEPISTPGGFVFSTCHIGRGWVNMRLKKLQINGNGTHLMLDPFMFAQCPNLVWADLSDSTTEYHCHEVPLSLPARLNGLENLKLQGLPALSFHPATFKTTTKLKKLLLSVETGSRASFFIPPVEELDTFYDGGAGPLWTSDWHLPKLTELTLTGEFAYRFQFRMLRGCPALQRLAFNMTDVTVAGEHIRMLKLDDFSATDTTITTTTVSNHTDLQKQTPTHIVLNSLRHLTLSGSWIFDDSVIFLLLYEMCPTICNIIFLGCSGFSHAAIAHTLRTRSKQFLGLSLSYPPPSAEEQVQLGMYPWKEWVMDRKETWNFSIHFQGERFFMLRDPGVFSGVRHAQQRQ